MANRREFMRLAAVGAAGATLAEGVTAAGPVWAVPAEPRPSLPVIGSRARFPVRRIYCMGLNYRAHVAEARDGFKAPPFYFQKSADMIVQNSTTIRYPLGTKDYEHELEMVVALKSGGANIAADRALGCVFGYATGLDMTRRDLQTKSMQGRQPWEPGKSFDQSAPCTAITPAERVGVINRGAIRLAVNGATRQDGDLSDMILDVPGIIAFLSQSVELAAGDIIYTGTPAGSGPVVSGDRMVGTIDKLETINIAVA